MGDFGAIGTLVNGIDLFGTGMGLTLGVILVGLARGMTNRSEMWGVIIATFGWLLALCIPSATFATVCFVMGTVAVTMMFTPILKQLETSNIFLVAIVSFMVNILLLTASGAYGYSFVWENNIDRINSDIEGIIDDVIYDTESTVPNHGLCTPAQESAGTCESKVKSGVINTLLFDIIGSALAIGTYIGKAIVFAGMAILAPLAIAQLLNSLVVNGFVLAGIFLYIVLWNILILYKIIMFVLNNRAK